MSTPAESTARGWGIAALVLAGLGWGVGLPLGKFAMAGMAPVQMVAWRFLIAAAAATPFVLARPAFGLFRSWPLLGAGVCYGAGFVLQFEGLGRVSVALAALLVGAMPALIAVVARLLGERVTKLSWAGVVAATLGAALIAGHPQGAGDPAGVALCLLSLVAFMGWLLFLRRAPETREPMAAPAVTVIVAAATIATLAVALHGPPPTPAGAATWAALTGQGLFSTLAATAAWQYGASRVGSATAGVFINIEPLLGATLGVLLFGDRLTAGLALGGFLILAGSFAVVMGERGAPATDLAHAPATPA